MTPTCSNVFLSALGKENQHSTSVGFAAKRNLSALSSQIQSTEHVISPRLRRIPSIETQERHLVIGTLSSPRTGGQPRDNSAHQTQTGYACCFLHHTPEKSTRYWECPFGKMSQATFISVLWGQRLVGPGAKYLWDKNLGNRAGLHRQQQAEPRGLFCIPKHAKDQTSLKLSELQSWSRGSQK